MTTESRIVYVCPNCFTMDQESGPCPTCGRERIECDPGDPDNPSRKPLMDAQGQLQSRAPLWWLAQSVPHLREQLRQLLGK
jgi:hypothetical protein